MSIHKSKGLQAEVVFIVGLSEGILPSKIHGLDTIEAQRRLLFTGMTRSLKRLWLLSNVEWDSKYIFTVDSSQFRYHGRYKQRGKVSGFITEMHLSVSK